MHGPGWHVTFGMVSRLKFEKVLDPVHPLKLYPTEIDVTFSSGEIVKLIGLPCAVVPLQLPALPSGVGEDELQALISPHHTKAMALNAAVEVVMI